MDTRGKLKIVNDPIYGFITIPNSFIFNLIEHPYFQRLRRITQMGLSYLVFPGAHHTRFHHALGSMHLMQKAVNVLRVKGIGISEEEEEALYIAILLHDVGHSPFSHALEHSIASELSHENISLILMHKLNTHFNGKLELAIKIFTGNYHRPFMCQLISSQLDMDRSDYLKRDSFYSGVAEGNINSERLIAMLSVVDDQLVVEEKGVYSVEKFLIARRFMYWQVYLHKTSLVAEQLLIRVLQRAKHLIRTNIEVETSKALHYFLKNEFSLAQFSDTDLAQYVSLDDVDIMMSLKQWQSHKDFILSQLSKMIIDRRLLKIKFQEEPIADSRVNKHLDRLISKHGLTADEANYFVFKNSVSNTGYRNDKDGIKILTRKGKIKILGQTYNHVNVNHLSKHVVKYYICFPKEFV